MALRRDVVIKRSYPSAGGGVRYVPGMLGGLIGAGIPSAGGAIAAAPSLLPSQEQVAAYGKNFAGGIIAALTPRNFETKAVNLGAAVGGAVLVILGVYGLIRSWRS